MYNIQGEWEDYISLLSDADICKLLVELITIRRSRPHTAEEALVFVLCQDEQGKRGE
jgi:hypothetical protein